MTCPRVQQNLKSYLDGELGPVARVGVRAHLLRCEACRTEAVALGAACDRLKLLPSPTSPAAIRARVCQAARSMRPVPHVPLPSRRRWLLPAFTAAALAAALTSVFLTRPTPAEAALNRVIAAAEAVRTCHMVFWSQQPGGARQTHHTWYAGGQWRMEDYRGGDLTRVQVYDGQASHCYSPPDNTVWLHTSDQPFGTPFQGFTVAAIIATTGDAEVTLEQARTQDGRLLNRFVVTDDALGERTVILADPHTDLPAAFEVYGRSLSGWELAAGTEKIEYDLPLAPDLFVLSYPDNARVVDMEQMREEWQRRYDEGMARVGINGGEAVLRDFQVTTLGDVHAIWSPGGPVGVPGPYATLTDSLGTVYLRVSAGFQAASDPCAWFVPLVPPNTAPSWYELTVGIGFRDEPHLTFRVEQPVLCPGPDPIYPLPDRTQGAVAFLWQDGPTAEVTRSEARATYWAKHGDLHQALRYFEHMTRTADRDLSPTYLAPTTWLEIGSLYEQVGRPDRARHAYWRGMDAYRGEDWYQGAADDLRARLERLR